MSIHVSKRGPCSYSCTRFTLWSIFLLEPVEFVHIFQDSFTNVVRLPQYQWSNPEEYGSTDHRTHEPTQNHNLTAVTQSLTNPCWIFIRLRIAGIVLWMRPANERRRYNVTSFLIGWAHQQNDPWIRCKLPGLSTVYPLIIRHTTKTHRLTDVTHNNTNTKMNALLFRVQYKYKFSHGISIQCWV